MTVWRPPREIRTKVLGLLIEDDHIFAEEVPGDSGEVAGIRPLGGSIEFGESRETALRREFAEELETRIDILGPFVTFENIFVHEGATGHEFLFVAPIRLRDRAIAIGEVIRFAERDGSLRQARWWTLDGWMEGRPLLYPHGLAAHLALTRGG